ncbi:olfactory receptor 1500-like [Dunckerocampus dactyliophorus]|uniref:olfactory receptor 1500-like n=1 Tax=Dunckerocampus dactyliophorus TaxID=161453 RepID=UPI002407393B|nr:olfactory receptor 1500-like [Dunckerocampus dactyliophorus]
MEMFNSALGRNITLVRPAYFFIGGFVGVPNIKYYYVFLLIVYVVCVLGNSLVMVVIVVDHKLRSPKNVVVFNLAFTDLLTSTVLVPKVLDTFMLEHRAIAYNDCLAFVFFYFSCLSMQSLNLVALGCDRTVAILLPLRYQQVVTIRSARLLVAALWLYAITLALMAAGLLTRLSFCRSVVINSYICDHGPMYRLGCNDITPSRVIAGLSTALVLWVPLVIILSSYVFIGYTLTRISTPQERIKALKTCSGQLSLVAVFYLPIIFVYRFGWTIHPNARIINLSLTAVLPPLLNPIIYTLQTQEIRKSVRRLLRGNKIAA